MKDKKERVHIILSKYMYYIYVLYVDPRSKFKVIKHTRKIELMSVSFNIFETVFPRWN